MQQTIALIATGGTIAGVSTENSASYTAGVLDIRDLLRAIPPLSTIAQIVTEQVFSIDSAQATPAHWVQIAQAVQTMAERDDIHGIVITHGTDTLEETAFYLHLVLKTKKPVVLVGAMRPADALSADGAQNMVDAVRLACDARASGQGVLVTMNQAVFSARYVMKSHTQHTASFSASETGPVAWIYHDQINWHASVQGIHTLNTPFDWATQLAPVEILFSYPGMNVRLYDPIQGAKAQGLIVAGLGNGSLPDDFAQCVKQWVEQGVVVVKSSRVLHGAVTGAAHQGEHLVANSLSAFKARVLLMLLLGHGDSTLLEQSSWNKF